MRPKAGHGSSRPSQPPPEAMPVAQREAVGLRLAIGRDGVGVELARPTLLACLDVTHLEVRIPHVKFPFDVSGGVGKFRHVRGELERLTFEIDARRAARWLAPLLRGLLGRETPEIAVAPRAFAATITVATGEAALAFEVGLVPAREDVAIVIFGARGANLDAPPTVLAMRAVAAIVGEVGDRRGSRFVVGRLAERIARHLFPEAGARAPAADGVVLVGSGESDGVAVFAFQRAGVIGTIPDELTRASEAAVLARESDDARFEGDFARARRLDVAALERAPRHPEITRRIAEVDAYVGGRAEAALAILRESPREAAPLTGTLVGRLVRDADGDAAAIAALLREGERDPSPLVGALCFAEAATLGSGDDVLAWLDAAVARAPRLASVRWRRGGARLAAGRLADARADFQELEALAVGPNARYEVRVGAADVYRRAGLAAEAALHYERALLYRPEDPAALAGLGIALAGQGRAARGAALLARAIEVSGDGAAWIELALARLLGDDLGDRPAAIARLRSIGDEREQAIDARGLEGRYRAALGDLAGASLAFARMRERAGTSATALPWLVEAARFERERGDIESAQRHAGAALALAPTDAAIEALYRELGHAIAERSGMRPSHGATVLAPRPKSPESPAWLRIGDEPTRIVDRQVLPDISGASLVPGAESIEGVPPELDDADAEARVESLTRSLQGDPTNDAVIDELAVLLTRLGRGMELLALLAARLEDAAPERRAELLPRHRGVLASLEADARAAGRDGEADLFKMAREATD